MEYQSENFNGNFDFRSRIHYGWFVGRHLHEYSEILYCQKGSAKVYIDGRCVCLPQKHLVWISPNSIHQYECADATVICAVFSNDYIPLFFHTTKGKKIIPSAIDVSDISDILDNFYNMERNNILLINAYLNLICARVTEKSQFEATNYTDGTIYQKVAAYLSMHFKEDISLKDIAKKFGYNEKYLSHSLHQITGVHFSKLLAMYRIENAKQILINQKSVSVAEVALMSGFSAINTFNRAFREITGKTPTEYRNRNAHL